MQQRFSMHKGWGGTWWRGSALVLLGLALVGSAALPVGVTGQVPASATSTLDFTPTATSTVDTTATAVWGTATAVSSTATAISLTATAQAAQGTVVSIGATQTALVATITALAVVSPSPTQSPAPSATPTPTPVPCLDSFEPDGEPRAAWPLLPGEAQRRLFCPAGDADWATFFGKAGKAYRLETSELTAGADTYLYLFAPDGQTLLAENDDALGGRGPSGMLWVPPADGWYFLQVKNQGDIGFPGLGYTLSLVLADAPTNTPALRPASATPTVSPMVTSGPPTNIPAATPAVVPSATLDPLLHPQTGGAGTGGVPVFLAGPADGMTPDRLDPNDQFEQAYAINVGALYQHLNFVPALPGPSDTDFYSFRTKPGNCYALTTGDLAAGLDTTILLWKAAPTREGRRLVAQNDDSHPHTPDLSSFVRWCNPLTGPDDLWLVAQIRNYGLTPGTDPRGKTYSLLVEIDPPTATPTPTLPPSPALSPVAPAPGGGGSGGRGTPAPVPPMPLTAQPGLPPPTPVPSPPASSLATATPVPVGMLTGTPTPASSATPSPTPTLTPAWVQVDVVAYVAPAADPNPLHGPQPDEGIEGVAVLLIDAPTNAVLQTALTDANGHAALRWAWSGPVRIALPAFRWGRALGWDEVQRESKGTGRLYLEARTTGYPLPGIFP